MPNPENIRPPVKGEIRNPKGKPVGTKNRSTILSKWIHVNTKVKNPITKETEAGTVEDLVMLALINRAMSGDVSAIKEINDTLYGKLTDKSEVAGAIQMSITMTKEETKQISQQLEDEC